MNKIKRGNVYKTLKNGSPYFRAEVKIYNGSKEIRKSFGRQKKYLLEEAIDEWIEKYMEINLDFNKNSSLEELFKSWIYTIKKPSVSSTTFEKYEVAYRLRIKDSKLGQTQLLDINSSLIQEFLNNLGENNSQKVCKETLKYLRSFFRYCKSEEYVRIDPTQNLSVKVTNEPVGRAAYTLEEQKIILENLDFYNPVDLAIYLSLTAGLRLGECLALEWKDVSKYNLNINRQFKRNVNIGIDGERTRGTEVSELKTENSYRDVPILKDTYNILMKYKVKQNELILSSWNYNNKNLIIADEHGKYLDKKRPTRKLKRICEENEIEYKTFHALRHTYITRLFEADVNPKTVQKLVGHKNIETTLNIYTHVNKNVKAEAVEKLQSVFGV